MRAAQSIERRHNSHRFVLVACIHKNHCACGSEQRAILSIDVLCCEALCQQTFLHSWNRGYTKWSRVQIHGKLVWVGRCGPLLVWTSSSLVISSSCLGRKGYILQTSHMPTALDHMALLRPRMLLDAGKKLMWEDTKALWKYESARDAKMRGGTMSLMNYVPGAFQRRIGAIFMASPWWVVRRRLRIAPRDAESLQGHMTHACRGLDSKKPLPSLATTTASTRSTRTGPTSTRGIQGLSCDGLSQRTLPPAKPCESRHATRSAKLSALAVVWLHIIISYHTMYTYIYFLFAICIFICIYSYNITIACVFWCTHGHTYRYVPHIEDHTCQKR